MQCPKCANAMEEISHPVAEAHRCTHCKGLWFAIQDHERLKDYAEQIDTGDAEEGARYNQVDRIACPECAGKRPLIRMVDPEQPHIWFESCKNCFGRFYDAGEFRDFAEHELADLIKDWNAPARD